MNSSVDSNSTTGTSDRFGSLGFRVDQILGTIVSAIGATSGACWSVSTTSFQVLSALPGKSEGSNPLLSLAIDHSMLNKLKQTSGPVLCHPELAGEGSIAILFGRLAIDEDLIVGVTIPVRRLREGNLTELKSQFVQALRELPVQTDIEQRKVSCDENTKTSEAKSIGIQELNLYLKAIYCSIETKAAAASIANETRRLMDCDRVSVLLKKRGKFSLVAISGQASVNRRSQTTQTIEKMADSILSAGQAFWYPDDSVVPTPIRRPLDHYLSTSMVRNLVVVPLLAEGSAADSVAASAKPFDQEAVLGGIVFEHFRECWDRESVESVIHMLRDHCTVVLSKAKQHEQLFLQPVWKALGNSPVLKAYRSLPQLALIAVGLVGMLLALLLWPVEFYVSAHGILVPEAYRPVFASADGVVDPIHLSHGDHVSQGDTLLTLSSPEHELRVSEVDSSLATARQRLTILKDQRHKMGKDELEKVEENIVSLKTRIENLEVQRAVLEKITESMRVKSPIDGEIVTWDLQRKLENRAISRGTQLLEIAQVKGKWLLEIDLPIQRLGHVRRAIKSRLTPDLRVSFILASDTGRRFSGHIVDIENSVAFNTSNQQVIKVWATVDDESLSLDQVRTGVHARIYCDRTSLGYQWFHGASEFLTRNVFFQFL